MMMITNQEEFDKINVSLKESGGWEDVLIDSRVPIMIPAYYMYRHIVALGSTKILNMSHQVHITAHDSSSISSSVGTITGEDSSQLFAGGNCVVFAHSACSVFASGTSVVEAYDESRVMGTEKATIRVYGTGTVSSVLFGIEDAVTIKVYNRKALVSGFNNTKISYYFR
jgi:hypothetical protein